MELTAAEKRHALRKMLDEPVCHIAPSCNDGIQARLVEWLGFSLVHISGSGQHRALGFADAGLLTLTEMITRAREIADAVNVPIVSDAETGYGNAVNVVRAVREFENTGVAAIHIEDQMTPKRAGHEGFDVGLVSKQEFVNKIKAAVDTRRDGNLVIIARSESKRFPAGTPRAHPGLPRSRRRRGLGQRAFRRGHQSIREPRQAGGRRPAPPGDVGTALGRARRPRRLHPDGTASRGIARHAPVFGGA